ncbi:MAG: Surfeit locus protein 4 [Alyxoria varia]|nr:MAG: Surfeit locus protein 4 [Alyxoria varia]
MAQIRGTAGYHLGNQGPFAGGPARNEANTDPSPLDAIREQTSKIEDMLDALAEPVKPRYTPYSVAGLMAVVVVQALGYGLIFDLNFFLRNLSVMGGLLMVLSDGWVRKKFAPAGLPQLDEKDRKMYFQLAGRVLLIFLFIGFVFSGDWNFGRVLVSIFGFVACVMVVVGFKAKWSAIMLVVILSLFNVVVNSWWALHHNHPQRDFAKYDFFQILSICGGLLLLVNMGPGQVSFDEKKKVY